MIYPLDSTIQQGRWSIFWPGRADKWMLEASTCSGVWGNPSPHRKFWNREAWKCCFHSWHFYLFFCLKLGGGGAQAPWFCSPCPTFEPVWLLWFLKNSEFSMVRVTRMPMNISGAYFTCLVNVIHVCLAVNDSIIFAATRNSPDQMVKSPPFHQFAPSKS